MSVAQLTPPTPLKANPPRADNRIVLYGIDWNSYQKFLEAVGTRHIRLTYDRGTLEIMTLGGMHEWWRSRISLVLRLVAAVLGIKVQCYGMTTLRRQDVDRGLEPDEGFYIQHAEQIYGPRNIDLSQDPPPDLALEIDITRSSLNRLGIYGALRIPEVWRFDGETIQVFGLLENGEYETRARSIAFPMVTLAELVAFIVETQERADTELIGLASDWVRQQVQPGGRPTTNGA
jgi:Uma2 family endonuclease